MKKSFAPPNSSVKLRFKKHLIPPLLGIGSMLLLLGFFNSQLIGGAVTHTNFEVNAAASEIDAAIAAAPLRADTELPRLVINKLNISAPVNYDLTEVDEKNFQIALRDGVVHYPDTAIPGQPGNIVIFGHSSNQLWAKGNYKFIFAPLDKLENGDSIILDYKGNRFIYTVTNKKIVKPTDLSVLDTTSSKRLTLITCTPVGSNTSRLIIEAEQTAPASSVTSDAASQKPASSVSEELYGKEKLPSSSTPSLWDEIRAIF